MVRDRVSNHILWETAEYRSDGEGKKPLVYFPSITSALDAVELINLLKASIVLLLALGFFSRAAFAQTDPLNPAYKPAIDANPANYPSNIWITDTMQKVRRDSGSPGTQHWGTFYGTQNEFVDFQVHVQANAGAISNLSVTASDFVNSRTSTTISASSTNIIVYREAYMNVTGQVTSTAATLYNAFGYYPDALIPAKDPYWGQTTNAWPFTVASGNNQSAWVDVLIPSNAPSGYYLGAVTVKSGTTTLATMPVIIGVWQWPSSGYMPSSTTLQIELTGWGYFALCINMYTGKTATTDGSVCSGYPDSGGTSDGANTQIQLDASMLLKDHRFSNGGQIGAYPESGSFSSYVSLATPNMNGTCRHGGTVCPVLPNSKDRTKPVQWLSAPSAAIWSNFQSNFNTRGWSSTLYDYLCDEPPNGCSWSTLNANATTRHGFLNPAIPELVTADYTHANANGALNSIDWMVVPISALEPIGGPLQSLATYQNWLSAVNPSGAMRQFWSYTGCGATGTCGNGTVGGTTFTYQNYAIDGKPAANRVMEWLTYMHGQTGELYYDADYCLLPANAATQCGYPTHPQDPWVSIYAFGNWGDGTLVYAGSVAPGTNSYMGSGVTTPIILPSVRLKHIRDGMQDYEYLYKLNAAGRGSLVTAQINSWITNSYTFETTGSGLQTARSILGKTLHQLTYPAPIPAAPWLFPPVIH